MKKGIYTSYTLDSKEHYYSKRKSAEHSAKTLRTKIERLENTEYSVLDHLGISPAEKALKMYAEIENIEKNSIVEIHPKTACKCLLFHTT